MGGKSVEFGFEGVSADKVWAAAVQTIGKLGYTVLHSDNTAKMLSFNTGRSMSSWAGQDLTMVLGGRQGYQGTVMTMGGSLGKGGNPFGGGSQAFAWGEKGRLIDLFAATVKQVLPSVGSTAAAATSTPVSAAAIDASVERNLYARPDGTWGWRLKVNGLVVATDGGQGYEDEADCRKIADRILGGEFANANKTITRPKKVEN